MHNQFRRKLDLNYNSHDVAFALVLFQLTFSFTRLQILGKAKFLNQKKLKSIAKVHLLINVLLFAVSHNLLPKLRLAETPIDESTHIEVAESLGLLLAHVQQKFVSMHKLLIFCYYLPMPHQILIDKGVLNVRSFGFVHADFSGHILHSSWKICQVSGELIHIFGQNGEFCSFGKAPACFKLSNQWTDYLQLIEVELVLSPVEAVLDDSFSGQIDNFEQIDKAIIILLERLTPLYGIPISRALLLNEQSHMFSAYFVVYLFL